MEIQETSNSASPRPTAPVAPLIHTVVFVLVIFVSAYFSARHVARLVLVPAQSHVFQYLQTIAMQWVLVAYIILGLRRSGTPVRQLIGGKWRSPDDFLMDVLIAAGYWTAAIGTLALVRWALGMLRISQLDEVKRTLGFLAPHGAAEIILWIVLCISAGFCEEFIFRGYLQRQFSAYTKNGIAGIILSAAVFGGVHLYQGGKAMLVIGIYGAMFGTLAYFRRSLRPGMMAHAWQDILSGLILSLLTK